MHPSVWIQTSAEPVPAVPPWFGEVAVIAQYLGHVGLLVTIEERVRFARRRFGHYDLVDFVVVLLGYAISGERRSKPSMSVSSRSPLYSWPSSGESASLTVQRSLAFSLS